MKRRMLAIILLCVGVAGLLLPWKYTLFENEYYRIEQTPTGGKAYVFVYEELLKELKNWDSHAPMRRDSIEEVIASLLSGDVYRSELLFSISGPEKEFSGLDVLFVPSFPEGYKQANFVCWDVDGVSYGFTKERKSTGNIGFCQGPEECRECQRLESLYAERETDQDESTICYALRNGGKAIVRKQDNGRMYVEMIGKDNGTYFHMNLYCNEDQMSKSFLQSFGAKRYFSTHPKMLMVYAINIGHGVGVVATLAGICLLAYPLLRKKRKTAEQES